MNQFVAEFFSRIVREEEGQDLVEYALLLGLIALVCVAAVTATGTKVSALFQAIADKIPGGGATTTAP